MPTVTKTVICWKDDTQFQIEVEDVTTYAEVRVILKHEAKEELAVGHKIIVKCPKCGAENEVQL